MKTTFLKTLGLLSLSSVLVLGLGTTAWAETDTVSGEGHIGFEGELPSGPMDPEEPATPVDPGETPSTSGPLRIDFVPTLNFHANKITDKDMIYPVNAQLFHDGTPARGNYVQVTDLRGGASGWTLQLRQETQFKNANTPNSQLDGAVLSLDKAWVNSTESANLAPSVSKDVIHLDNIGATYNLAEASSGKGNGTWLISFGASQTNPKDLESTLTPKLDSSGEAVLDPAFENQQIQENRAITLSIPGATKIDPVTYSTVLTWVLAELP